MSTHRLIAGTALALSTAILLTGCASAAPPDSAVPTTLRISTIPPATFDPTLSASLPDYQVARMSFDTLVRRDDAGLVGGLASEWTSTPTRAVFTIRDDATCSDGTKITPSIVQSSLEYFARPDAGTTTPGQVFGGNTPAFTADDDAMTLTIDLATPWPDLITGLSISSTGIVCPAGLADPTALGTGSVEGAESGPYILSASQPGISYDYSLRDDYDAWPEWTTPVTGAPPKTLQFIATSDSTAISNQIISGQMDIGGIQAQSVDRFTGIEGYTVTSAGFSDLYLVFNEREGSPFTDPTVRLGVARAIDRAQIEEVISLGQGEVSTSLASSLIPCVPTDNPNIPEQDVAAAKAALGGISIRFIGPNIAGANGSGNEYIAEALRDAGAEVTVENTDVGTWISTVFGQPQAWDLTLFADLNFLGSLTSPLTSFLGAPIQEGGGNIGAVVNDEATAAFAASLTEGAAEARCASLNASVDALIDRVDTLPLSEMPFIYASRPGFTIQTRGGALDDPILRIEG